MGTLTHYCYKCKIWTTRQSDAKNPTCSQCRQKLNEQKEDKFPLVEKAYENETLEEVE